MEFSILRSSDPDDAEVWDDAVQKIPKDRRDIHFTSAYGRVQERLGYEAILGLWSDEENEAFVIQPFVKRATPYDLSLFDISSPYGYGGPISNVDDPPLLHRHLYDSEVVCEFCRLHPIFEKHQRKILDAKIDRGKEVVIVGFPLKEESVSRRIRRALQKSLHAEFSDCGNMVNEYGSKYFCDLYRSSMERMGAANHWKFSDEYIDAHFTELAARLFLIAGSGGGERALMTIGRPGHIAYAHFLGSNGKEHNGGLDERLYFMAADCLRRDGFWYLHLGGGLTDDPEDSLLQFKQGFSKQKYYCYSYELTFNIKAMAYLNAEKSAEERKLHGAVSTSKFFPPYRREMRK